MNKVLVVVDMQNDFVSGTLGSEMAKSIIPSIQEKIERAKEEGDHILFTQDSHDELYMETLEGRKLPVKHCIRGTEGWKIIPEFEKYISPTEQFVHTVSKTTFGSIFLQALIPHETEEIELCGVCTDICVVSNALLLRAKFPNMNITVDPLACAGTTEENHKSALLVMQSCQIDIK